MPLAASASYMIVQLLNYGESLGGITIMMERTASHSMQMASHSVGMTARAAPAGHSRFAPIDDCAGTIFAALKLKERRSTDESPVTQRKPRFALLRGEVAQMAERVFQIAR